LILAETENLLLTGYGRSRDSSSKIRKSSHLGPSNEKIRLPLSRIVS